MATLRLLTFNTANCDGPYRARLGWTIEEIQRLQPDVIALQEAFRSESGQMDTAAALSRALDFSLFWSPARSKDRVCEGVTVPGWSGMALLGRRPWLEVETLQLPEDPRDGDRVAQIGVLSWDGTTVTFANVHLTYLPEANALRREQLDVVLRHPLLLRSTGPAVICGDFNTRLEQPVLAPLLASSEGSSLRDAFVAGGDPGASTLPSRIPRRIDHILSRASDPAKHPVFTDSAIVLDRRQPLTNVLPSDHFGVSTTMQI